MQLKRDKIKFYKNMAKFIELAIWSLVVILVVFVFVGYNTYSQRNYARYQIFMQDVDGIIVGSPVRMLGITVGYVKHIKVINDMVYVDFIINQKGIEIPKGSKVTVEFSGLGGSKSLEIYTPKDKYDANQPALTVQQPRRIGASVKLLYHMFKKIGDIIYRCTYFSDKLEFDKIKTKHSTNNSKKDFLDEANIWLDKMNNRK